MTLEKELLTATGVKKKDHKNRQALLAAVARVVEKLPETEYGALTDPALDWYEAAAKAMKEDETVPEFDDLAPPKKPDDDDEADDATEGDEADEDADYDDEEVEEAQALSSAPDEPVGSDDTAIGGDTDGTEEPTPAEEAPKTKKGKKAKKAKKAEAKAEAAEKKPSPTRYDNLSGKKNRYGIYEGTKLDDVCKLLEKGVTQAQIKEAVGDTKYNLVKRLKKDGHLVEKNGPKFTLTHKDDVQKPKGKKK